MRDLRFRAWDKNNPEMLGPMTLTQWIEQDLDMPYATRHFVWMQFTGLATNNGADIYEGDVVEQLFTSGKKEVGRVFIDPLRGVLVGNKPIWLRRARVIGNVWENPELLNQGE